MVWTEVRLLNECFVIKHLATAPKRNQQRPKSKRDNIYWKLHINEYCCQAWFKWLSLRPIYMHRNEAKRFVLPKQIPTWIMYDRQMHIWIFPALAFKCFTFLNWTTIVSSLIIAVYFSSDLFFMKMAFMGIRMGFSCCFFMMKRIWTDISEFFFKKGIIVSLFIG